jgi:hypothetical protein
MRHLHRWAFVLPCSLTLLGCASANQRRTTDGYFDPYVITLDLQAALQTDATGRSRAAESINDEVHLERT